MPESVTWTVMGLNLDGFIAGVATWAIIWGSRYACIKGEYHFRRAFRYVFLLMGVLGLVAALWTENLVVSAIFGIFGFANLWGIHEVIEQEERVKKGWYPRKPGKQ